MEKTQELKERDYMEGVEVQINEIEVQTSKLDREQVEKIRFHTNKGDITYKPKVERTENRNGLLIKRREACLIDDLPEKITNMANMIAKSGTITVVVAYSIWNTEKDGEAVTYRFIQGAATLAKWHVVDSGTPKVERVV